MLAMVRHELGERIRRRLTPNNRGNFVAPGAANEHAAAQHLTIVMEAFEDHSQYLGIVNCCVHLLYLKSLLRRILTGLMMGSTVRTFHVKLSYQQVFVAWCFLSSVEV
jgi:hypothetical protein